MRKGLRGCLLLAVSLIMALSVAGCGKTASTEVTFDKNTVYKEEELSIPFPEGSYINTVSVGKDKVFFAGWSDSVDNSGRYFYGTCNLDGSDYTEMEMKSEDENGGAWIDRIYASSDDTAIVTYSEYSWTEEDSSFYYYLLKIDGNGNEISRTDLSEAGISYVDTMLICKDGSVLVYSNNTLYHVGTDGSLLAEKDVSSISYVEDLFTLKDGTVCIRYYGDEDELTKKLNPDTLEIGDDVTLSVAISNYSIMDGNDTYDMLLRSSSSIYGYNVGDAAPTEIFNMVNSDISTSYFDCFASCEDGSYIGTYTDYTGDENKTYVCRYTKVDPADIKDKEILTLGCTYIDSDIRSQVVKFNKTSEDVRIVIKDYSTYNTDDDYSAGETKLNSDIASGKGPDIVVSDDPSMIANYVSKGLFTDLHQYLDTDTTIDVSDIWPNLITACETDGKLYELVPSFYVQTEVGKKSLLGDRTGWTMQEMKDFADSLPEGTSLFATMSRDNFLNMMLNTTGKDFVDKANATCSFDTDEFKAILNYAVTLPAEIDYDEDYYNGYDSLWRTDSVVLYDWYISSADDYQQVLRGYIGEDISIVGYPTVDGSNGSFMTYYESLAISSKCKLPEKAWEFIRTFWGSDYQSSQSWGITASMSQFKKSCESAMTRPSYTDYDGNVVYYDNTWYANDTEIVMDPLTQEEVDDLVNFIATVDKTSGSLDEDIYDIISDESQSFFNGQKSVDDVTDIIQNRVSTYLKEKQ